MEILHCKSGCHNNRPLLSYRFYQSNNDEYSSTMSSSVSFSSSYTFSGLKQGYGYAFSTSMFKYTNDVFLLEYSLGRNRQIL
jgi:hypothetical protein